MNKIDNLTIVFSGQKMWDWNTSWWWIEKVEEKTKKDFSKLLYWDDFKDKSKELQEKEEEEYLNDRVNIFFINWKYYACLAEIAPEKELKLKELNNDKNLKYLEKRAIFFDNIKRVGDKIIMSNNLWNFIVFDKNTDNIIYESKKGEILAEESLGKSILTIIKPYWLTSELNIETWEESENETENKRVKYSFLWKRFWKLIIPTYFIENNDFDWFLRSSYLWKLLKLWKKWTNIFDIANKPEFKEILLETIENNFSIFATKIKFEKDIDWWPFFNWLEKYIEENYEKYSQIIKLDNMWKNYSKIGKSVIKQTHYNWEAIDCQYFYVKLFDKKFLKMEKKDWVEYKRWDYYICKEVLTWDEYLIKLDENSNIEHVVKK